ncbi:uncharacterized protein OCT59_018277 [Rhizophagus irregularis]|uniref:Uncharacterized protein n=1 Tax=Rhizophagus irregularis (strain DAOM 197198w) TaxID=1432141 RepID=A0A015L3Z3_RHIIW|nr:hypothetical protein RirG_117210 [Rhizophagus irregularis DAOM 197198w]UZO26028.1 hypothetical protein OCT59_018277 [Rhizophagus irregularis]
MGLSSDEAWLCMPCPVASTGYILCDDCGTAKDWKDWRFKCGNENHKFYEYPAEDLDFIHALGSAMSLKAHSPEKRRVVMKIINKISGSQC